MTGSQFSTGVDNKTTRAKPEKREPEDLICQLYSSFKLVSRELWQHLHPKINLLKILKYFNTISEKGSPSEPTCESTLDKNI